MANYNGAPSAAQLITEFDQIGAVLENCYGTLGLGIAGETGTTAAQVAIARAAIVGDGTTSNPGLGNILGPNLAPSLDAMAGYVRWDALFSKLGNQPVRQADTQIQNNVPSGWLLTDLTNVHYLNNHLLRMNSAHTGVPTTPSITPTLAATTGGALPNFSSGNCPRVVYTFCGASELDESLPSTPATGVACSGGNNALTMTIPGGGNVPAGVTLIKVYRGYVAGGVGIWYYDQKVAVTAGQPYASFPITITQPDSALKTDWVPPSWLICLLKPPAACLVALAYSVTGGGNAFLSVAPGAPLPGVPLPLLAANMLSPQNVAFGPSNGFLGLGNNYSTQGAIFGTTVIGTGFTAGTLQTANNAAAGLQGFGGTTALRCRITVACNAAPTVSLTYSYYDATQGYGSAQSASIGGTFSSTAVGTILNLSVPAGRLVYAVTADSPTGAASGTYITESQAIR